MKNLSGNKLSIVAAVSYCHVFIQFISSRVNIKSGKQKLLALLKILSRATRFKVVFVHVFLFAGIF